MRRMQGCIIALQPYSNIYIHAYHLEKRPQRTRFSYEGWRKNHELWSDRLVQFARTIDNNTRIMYLCCQMAYHLVNKGQQQSIKVIYKGRNFNPQQKQRGSFGIDNSCYEKDHRQNSLSMNRDCRKDLNSHLIPPQSQYHQLQYLKSLIFDIPSTLSSIYGYTPQKINKHFLASSPSSYLQSISLESVDQQNQKLIRNINTMKRIFQRQTIFSLKQSWNEQGIQLFNQFFLHAEPFEPSEDIRSLIQIIQFRMFKKQALFEKMLSGITKTIHLIAHHFKLPTLNSLFEEFKKKEQNNLQVSQNKLCYYFLEQFKEEHQISVEKDQTKIDNILFSYIDQSRRNRDRRKVDFEVKHNGQKVPIKKFITEFPLLSDGTPVLLNYLHSIRHLIKNQNQKKRELSLERMAKQNHTNCYRCLGCTSSFELNSSVNMDEIGQRPFVLIPTILNSMNTDLANYIVALLNSGGGLIFFDMKAEYRDVFPQGAIIDVEKQDSIRAEFTQILRKVMYFESTQFSTGIDQLVEIDFVPVKADADEDNFIEGRYITRIRVCPQDSTLVFYKENKQSIESFYREPNGSIRAIKHLSIKRFMRNKIRAFHSEIPNLLARKPQNYFQHKCTPPEKGNPTRSLRQLREGEDMMLRQRAYKSMSIIVCKDSTIKIIKEKLSERRVAFNIHRLFQKYKFHVAKYTAILYHNLQSKKDVEWILEKYDELSSKSKHLVIIDVTRHLLVKQRNSSNRFSMEELRNFKEMFKKEFEKETFKLYEYRQCKQNEMKEMYYIETESKTSIVFLYYLLNHLDTRVMMIEPKSAGKYLVGNMDNRRKLIYSTAEPQ